MTSKHLITSLALVGGLLATAGTASADRRLNTLPGDVAVRHRLLLVSHRLEFTPLFESTINADFRHILGGGAKLEYHLGDKLSIGAIGVFSTSLNTKLIDRIIPSLLTQQDKIAAENGPDHIHGTADDISIREPSQTEFEDHLNEMPLHGAAYLSLTPWYGKLAAFGAAYVAFDFYFQAGVSFAQLKSDCPSNVCDDKNPGMSTPSSDPENPNPPDNDPNNDAPLNSGSRLGLYLGGGIHVFFNDFIALDMTVRDYAFSDNPSGADFNADLFVDKNDSRFIHHLFFGAGLSIMLPFNAKRTN